MTKIILLFFFSMVGLSLSAQPLTVRVAPYYQGRKAALSLTFGDGLQEHFTLLRPELNRRGLRATFAIVGSKVGGVMHSSQDKAMGISGTPCDLFHYRVLMTYNRSWGTYDEPTNHVMHDFSWLIDATFSPQKWDGWKIGLSIAGDTGSLMGKSTGAMLTLTKTGWIH